MKQKMATCPACGVAALSATVEDVEVPFRAGVVTVPAVEVTVCEACGERPMSADDAERLHMRAVDIARKERGLLTPDEIRSIRLRRGLTQRQMELALGVGEKTVVRWEKGIVFQGAAPNTLLELIRDMDGFAELLLESRKASAKPVAPQTRRVAVPTNTAWAMCALEAFRVGWASSAATSFEEKVQLTATGQQSLTAPPSGTSDYSTFANWDISVDNTETQGDVVEYSLAA